jgi:hypothetical protein
VDCCEHDNDISGVMNAVYPLTLSDSQKFGTIGLGYKFYADFFFFPVTFSDVEGRITWREDEKKA